MAVQQEHLIDGATLWNKRICFGESIICRRDGIPWTQVAPVFGYVKAVTKPSRAMRLRDNQWERLGGGIVVWVRGRSLNSCRLFSRGSRSRETNDRLVREERGVDLGLGEVSSCLRQVQRRSLLLAGGKISDTAEPAVFELETGLEAAADATSARRANAATLHME